LRRLSFSRIKLARSLENGLKTPFEIRSNARFWINLVRDFSRCGAYQQGSLTAQNPSLPRDLAFAAKHR
jgi:hypothetical protein